MFDELLCLATGVMREYLPGVTLTYLYFRHAQAIRTCQMFSNNAIAGEMNCHHGRFEILHARQREADPGATGAVYHELMVTCAIGPLVVSASLSLGTNLGVRGAGKRRERRDA